MFGLMPSLGFASFVQLATFIVIVILVWRERKYGFVSGTHLVLKKFRLYEAPASKVLVEISGRASGIVSWFLNLLKLNPDIELVVNDSEVVLHRASLSGFSHASIPIEKINLTICGYQRSIIALGFALFFAVNTILAMLLLLFNTLFHSSREPTFFPTAPDPTGLELGAVFVNLVFTAIAVGVFWFSKRIAIGVRSSSTDSIGVTFKRSFIENISVDLPQAIKTVNLINNQILSSQLGRRMSSAPDAPTTEASLWCSKCSTPSSMGTRFCENCGSPLL
jgi:hypothetical protein